MTVSYKLIPTSGKLASKKPFKALCAPYATASLQEMGRNIERGTTFSMSDLAGALEALSKELKAQLLAGNRVHLPGLGFFSLAIKGELRTHPRTHRPRHRSRPCRGYFHLRRHRSGQPRRQGHLLEAPRRRPAAHPNSRLLH